MKIISAFVLLCVSYHKDIKTEEEKQATKVHPSNMEYTFRAVTQNPGIIIWRIEVMWRCIRDCGAKTFILPEEKWCKEGGILVMSSELNWTPSSLCAIENGAGPNPWEILWKLLRGWLLRTSVCESAVTDESLCCLFVYLSSTLFSSQLLSSFLQYIR